MLISLGTWRNRLRWSKSYTTGLDWEGGRGSKCMVAMVSSRSLAKACSILHCVSNGVDN